MLSFPLKRYRPGIFGNDVVLWRVKATWSQVELEEGKRPDPHDTECLGQATSSLTLGHFSSLRQFISPLQK